MILVGTRQHAAVNQPQLHIYQMFRRSPANEFKIVAVTQATHTNISRMTQEDQIKQNTRGVHQSFSDFVSYLISPEHEQCEFYFA